MRSLILSILFPILVMAVGTSLAGAQAVGIFTNAADVGEVAAEGLAIFRADTGVYEIEVDAGGIGYNQFALNDMFRFVYVEMSGSFEIVATPLVLEDVGQGGVMARQSLDDDAPFVFAHTVNGVGPAANSALGTWRSAKGAGAMSLDGEIELDGGNIGVLRLQRIGNTFTCSSLSSRGRWSTVSENVVQMRDPILVGIAAAGSASQWAIWEIEGVELTELPCTVERILPVRTFTSGADLTAVSVAARVRSGTSVDITITEEPPKGSAVSNVKTTAGTAELDDEGNILWSLPQATGESTLTYDVTLPETSNQVAIFRGEFMWSGLTRVRGEIGGEMILPIPELAPDPLGPYSMRPITDPFPLSLTDEIFIEAERMDQADTIGWAIGVDPDLSSGVYMIEVDGDGELHVHVDVKEAGTYFVYGQVRGEDGNSDSGHIDILDEFRLAGGSAEDRWNFASGQWSRDWAEEYEVMDPRAWELEPGPNTFIVGVREEGAKLDWIVITADDSTRIGTIVDEESFRTRPRFIPTGVIKVADSPVHIEAEHATLQSGFYAEEKPEVFSEYVAVADARGIGRDGALQPGEIQFRLNVQQSGTYYIFAKVVAQYPSYNSFLVGTDGDVQTSDEYLFVFPEPTGDWTRTIVTSGEDRTPRAFELSTGEHVINWHVGQRRARLDWILITKDPNFDINGFDESGGVAPPTPTPTLPPPPLTPTPTSPPAPTATPTPPPTAAEFLNVRFDEATVEDAGFLYSPATGFDAARISVGSVPSGPETDGRGLIIDAGPGEGTLAIMNTPVSVGTGPVSVSVLVQANGLGCSVALAALNSPIDGQLGYTISSDTDIPVGEWGRLVLLYDAPNDTLQPGIQVAVPSASPGVTVYFDNLLVTELLAPSIVDVALDADGSFESGSAGISQNVNNNTGTVDFTSQPGKVVLSIADTDDAANIGIFASSLQGGFPHVLEASLDARLLSGSGGVTALVITNGNGNVGVFVNNSSLPGASEPPATITIGGGFEAENPAFPILCVVQNGGPGVTSAVAIDNLRLRRIR